jgi:hypothetical protein
MPFDRLLEERLTLVTIAGTVVRESTALRSKEGSNRCIEATAVKCMASQIVKRLKVCDAGGRESSLLRADPDCYFTTLQIIGGWLATQLADITRCKRLLVDFTKEVPQELSALLKDAGLRNPIWPQFAAGLGCDDGRVVVRAYDNPGDPLADSVEVYVAQLL